MSLSGGLITLGNLHNLCAVTHSFQIISLLPKDSDSKVFLPVYALLDFSKTI